MGLYVELGAGLGRGIHGDAVKWSGNVGVLVGKAFGARVCNRTGRMLKRGCSVELDMTVSLEGAQLGRPKKRRRIRLGWH